MTINRQMPIIRVSHSVLEEQSRINRKEMVSGKEDRSQRSQRVKAVSATKDVVLVGDFEREAVEPKPDNRIDLSVLPRQLKTAIILNYGLWDHATPNCSSRLLERERLRQIRAFVVAKKQQCKEEQRERKTTRRTK
jgi:hypothetical protein